MITPESAKFGVDCNGVMAMSCGIFYRGKSTQTLRENPISWMGPLAQLGLTKLMNVSRSAPRSAGGVISRPASAFAKAPPRRAAARLPSAPPP